MFAIYNSHYDRYYIYSNSSWSLTTLFLCLCFFPSVKDSFLEIVVSHVRYFMNTLSPNPFSMSEPSHYQSAKYALPANF